MKYLVSVIDDNTGSATPTEVAAIDDNTGSATPTEVAAIDDNTGSATPTGMAAIDAFNDRLEAEGHWVFAGGLALPSTATVIDNRGDEAVFTDGPFVETKEYVGGFWIIEAPDLDVALKLAAEGSKSCNRKVEVRPLLGE